MKVLTTSPVDRHFLRTAATLSADLCNETVDPTIRPLKQKTMLLPNFLPRNVIAKLTASSSTCASAIISATAIAARRLVVERPAAVGERRMPSWRDERSRVGGRDGADAGLGSVLWRMG